MCVHAFLHNVPVRRITSKPLKNDQKREIYRLRASLLFQFSSSFYTYVVNVILDFNNTDLSFRLCWTENSKMTTESWIGPCDEPILYHCWWLIRFHSLPFFVTYIQSFLFLCFLSLFFFFWGLNLLPISAFNVLLYMKYLSFVFPDTTLRERRDCFRNTRESVKYMGKPFLAFLLADTTKDVDCSKFLNAEI